MKQIDINNWNRKNHFNYFKQLDYPHFNICGNINITNFYNYIKENNLPFFLSILYLTTKIANTIPEFKYRIRDNMVVEHEIISPSFTVTSEENLFSFCTSTFVDNYNTFKDNTLNEIDKVKNNIVLEDEPGRDDLIYISSIPWISFTSITHPIQLSQKESIPRITWGKYFTENDEIKLPISIQVNHALVDGIHVGMYFNALEEALKNPSKHL